MLFRAPWANWTLSVLAIGPTPRKFTAIAPRALAILRAGPDLEGLQAAFEHEGWQLQNAESVESGLSIQNVRSFPIVFYQRDFRPGWWREVARLSEVTPRPSIIVLAGVRDNNLGDEVRRWGGFDVLRTPIHRIELIAAVRAGWLLWQSRNRLQEHELKRTRAKSPPAGSGAG